MKRVIWGAGYVGSKLMYNIGAENISFFIDKEPSKEGYFLGKPVILPQNVRNWNELYIYIPFNFYEEIKTFLLKMGLKENSDFVKYENKFRISYEKAENELKYKLDELDLVKEKWRNGILYFTSQVFQEMGCLNFFRVMQRNALELKFVSEAYWMSKNDTENLFNNKLDVLIVPRLWEYCSFTTDGYIDEEKKSEVKNRPYLLEVVDQVHSIFNDIDEENCFYLVYYNFKYIITLINKLHPRQIIYSSEVKPNGRILLEICREKKIPIITTHQGIIPGTLSYDVGGEMGASLPAIYSDKFLGLPVNEEELIYTKKVWKYLYESKLNRRKQPRNNCKAFIESRIRKNRPIIFFAGQNDPESHMVPYTDNTKKFHSPIFKSSVECGIYLAKLCEKNEWNFVYKPHPLYARDEWEEQFPSNVIYAKSGDVNELIDLSDVTVTILSGTSYNALTRYKPVVMLGYTQLRGKGCTYEAFEKDRIESEIKEALEKGFTKDQQEAFLKHMAQCLKYYLYDDQQERPIRYGRSVPKSIDEFYELERLLR